jgi:hypothetical protein
MLERRPQETMSEDDALEELDRITREHPELGAELGLPGLEVHQKEKTHGNEEDAARNDDEESQTA